MGFRSGRVKTDLSLSWLWHRRGSGSSSQTSFKWEEEERTLAKPQELAYSFAFP